MEAQGAPDDSPAIPISAAIDATLPLGDGISLWYASTYCHVAGALYICAMDFVPFFQLTDKSHYWSEQVPHGASGLSA